MVMFGPSGGKWLAVALTASLGVNLFLAGMYTAHLIAPPAPFAEQRRAGPNERGMPPWVDRMAESLSAGDRATFTGTIGRHQAEIMAAGSAVREQRQKVRDLLVADNFDKTAAEAAFGELRQRNTQFQSALHGALIDAASALPASARRTMVNAGRRGPARQ